MGGKEVEQKTTTPQEIENYLNELFAYALSIGMTYEQYWYDDPYLLKHYIRAEEIRWAKKNQELWLQGLYVHIAVGDLVPILNPFSKDHKAKKYLDKPLPITQKEQEKEQEEKLKRFVNYMDSLAIKGQAKALDNQEK